MFKANIVKVITLLIVLSFFSTLLGACSSNTFDISNEKLKEDIYGMRLNLGQGVLSSYLVLSNENIKELNIVDKLIEGKNAKVIAKISCEYIDTGKGGLNKHMKKNDINYSISGDIVINYIKHEKDWRIDALIGSDNLKVNTKEIETLIEVIPFNKSENEIIQDLKKDNTGIQISDIISATVTFDENKVLGYIPIQQVNSFKITKSEISPQNDLWNEVTISADFDFRKDSPNNMFEDNGDYNAKGEFVLIYRLEEDKSDNPIWNLSSIKSFSSRFKIVKK